MANKEKCEIKIGILEQEIKEIEKEIASTKDSIRLWVGYEQACGEALNDINAIFRKIKAGMDWSMLSDEDSNKFAKLQEVWHELNADERLKEYIAFVPSLTIDHKDFKTITRKPPITVPEILITREEGAKFSGMLRGYQAVLTAKLEKSKSEPLAANSQVIILQKQIDRMKRQIEFERAKIKKIEDEEAEELNATNTD